MISLQSKHYMPHLPIEGAAHASRSRAFYLYQEMLSEGSKVRAEQIGLRIQPRKPRGVKWNEKIRKRKYRLERRVQDR